MKKYLIALLAVALFVGVTAIHLEKKYREQINTLKANTEILMTDVSKYKVADSLNAAKVGVLTLEIDQYKELRAKDLQTISGMGIRCSNLQSINKAQTATINRISGSVRDSIVFVDRIITDTLKCLKTEEKWLSLDICISDDGTYKGEICSRDSLLIVTEVKYKRFLGFLWKTNKVKYRKTHIISKNPATEIMGFESILIEN